MKINPADRIAKINLLLCSFAEYDCFRVIFRALKMAMAIPAMEMILPQSSGGNIPAFLAKLWKMVNNPEIGKT